MRDMGLVRGSAAQAVPLVVGKDTVYVHTDIRPVTEPREPDGEIPKDEFEYHEVQYDKDEYIRVLSEKNDSLEEQLTDTQLALVEIYEGVLLNG